MLRPVGYFRTFLCPFEGAAGGGCGRPHCQYRHREPPPASAAAPAPDLLVSSIEKEDENANQSLKSEEVFPCEPQEESSRMSPLRTRCASTKRSNSSTVKLEIKLQDSDDEYDLVIDVPPFTVNKKPRISRNCENSNKEELAAVIRAKELHASDVADSPSRCAVEKSKEIITCQKEDRNLNKSKTLNDVSPETSKIYLSDVNTEIPKFSGNLMEKTNAFVYSEEEHWSSAICLEAGMQKKTLKPEIAQTNMLVEASVQGHSPNNCITSKGVVQSVWNSSYSLGDKSISGGNSKEMIINIEKIQSIEENKGNDILEDTCHYLDDYLNVGKEACYKTDLAKKNNKKTLVEAVCASNESKMTIFDSSSEEVESNEGDTEFSESDDPIEECRRIFYEFEKEVQKKDDKQVHGENVDLLKTEEDVLVQKKRITHAANLDVQSKKETGPFRVSLQQGDNARMQQEAVEFIDAGRNEDFVATTSGKKEPVLELSATEVQSIGPVACFNLLEVQPVEANSSQLCALLERNVTAVVPYRPSFKRVAPVQSKVSTGKKPSIPESGSKVPHDIRQRYFSFFLEECFKIYGTVNEAIDKALIEEKSIYDRCGSKNMYLNIAVNTLKKLRNHGQLSDCKSLGETGSMKSEEKNDLTNAALYELLKDYLLTKEQLDENNFPQPHPEKHGNAVFNGIIKKKLCDAFRRVCCRCGKVYTVTSSGRHTRKEECNYHFGRVLEQKVPGGLEKRYSCCEGFVGSPGCQVAKLHVHDGRQKILEGFVRTRSKSPPFDGNYGVYALDCEMCYTTQGLELTRVTVVDPKLQIVYDSFVKPGGEIIDYNMRFSGVTEDDLKNTTTSLQDVHAVLLSLFSADTILIGHSLENDLFGLKLIHDKIIDTSVMFPHRLGFPHKRALKSLMADYLRRLSQDDVGGHNCSEDAIACMELTLWKIKEDKGRKW
ncbi:RNA exonuclease 1 homolog [Nothoprocta perdicaria]|uniref:RNA exonuclease 1 homolog n=1 Tax=Nothoprocta perdicaria TaxID=30464 RepID=UPI000E1BA942|nr:RNA exonuclease 1 homolog [Nothoprocta perdicaria]